jgi:hypothetical protein
MELPGTGYLYNLTLISVTFAGFAALIAAFRQMVGGKLTKHDAFLIRSALMRSLIVIICALLPPLLALFEIQASVIWRTSSFIAAGLITVFTLVWPTIVRRNATSRPISLTAKIYHLVQLLAALLTGRSRVYPASLRWLFRRGSDHLHDHKLDFRPALPRNFVSHK